MQHLLRWSSRLVVLACLAGLAVSGPPASSRPAPPPGSRLPADLYAAKVAPLLRRCLSCHGGIRREAGLDLRNRAGMIRGGDSGPALAPGSSKRSLLFRMVAGRQMPPRKADHLSVAEIDVLRAWIDDGARAPGESSAFDKSKTDFWSFCKPVRPTPPAVALADAKHVINPLDRFILAKLREKRLTPAPRADAETLVRRASFDLQGLPPAPELVERFKKDPSPAGFARLVDELMTSPAYGERWGRHWLDVARYADSGGFETDIYYRNAWRYRDWVVKSFNDDKPYDRFVLEQVAGDELWPEELEMAGAQTVLPARLRSLEARTGTGLFAIGPQVHESNMDGKKRDYEELTDRVDTTGSIFLGLTIGCARCHDHKFDPISQKDYFSLQAVFAGARVVEEPIVNPMEQTDHKQHYPRILAVDEARRAYRLFAKKTAGRFLSPAEQAENQRLRDRIAQAVLDLPEAATSSPNTPWDGLMEVPRVSVLSPRLAAHIPEVRILNRGDLDRARQVVEPDLPAVLRQATRYWKPFPRGVGSRSALAKWLVRPDHPLTARILVNRVWHWHFGRGLVSTPGDFGKMGQPPSHPELLDWLATEFVEKRWSLKALHRLIMTSAAYQRSSRFDDEANRKSDPDNRYLWRANRRRLEGESIWDALHATSGTLNRKVGGRPVVPPLVEEELSPLRDRWHWTVSADPADHTRRGLYILSRRNFRFPMLESFDAPVSSVSCPKRETTTVAPQALWMMNNRIALAQAHAFAGRLVRESGKRPEDWIDRAWRLALGRAPSDREATSARKLLADLERSGAPLPDLPAALQPLPAARASALVKLCLAVFNLNEFIHVD